MNNQQPLTLEQKKAQAFDLGEQITYLTAVHNQLRQEIAQEMMKLREQSQIKMPEAVIDPKTDPLQVKVPWANGSTPSIHKKERKR